MSLWTPQWFTMMQVHLHSHSAALARLAERRCKDNCTIMLLVFGSSSEGGAAAQQLAPVAETSAAADGQMPAAAVT